MGGAHRRGQLSAALGAAALMLIIVLVPTGVGAREPLVLVDPSSGQWHVRADGGVSAFYFGDPNDFPIFGDWDCDGTATPGLYRQKDGFVYLSNANRSQVADVAFFFGDPSDVPLAGDFNGDGCDTTSIYRPSEGRIYIMNRLGTDGGGLGAADISYTFGNPGDRPFVGDFDGDGVDSIGLYRETTGFVYFRNPHSSGIAERQFFYGDPSDFITAGDWEDDGVDTVAIYRQQDQSFYLRYTNTPGAADEVVLFGDRNWIPPGHAPPAGAPAACDASYPTVCIPSPPPDLDCSEITYTDFAVRGGDPHGFDGDKDGVGCETTGDSPPPPPSPSPTCDSHYPTVCIPPPPPDLDCGQIRFRNFRVVGGDPHRFDRDRDGIGCET